jgi:LacI family transcriptional regulator
MTTKSRRTKRPTQADVARLANVSQTTVSLVLNNDQIASVPPETRQRIREAMEALGYVPDRVARSLRTRRTYTIAGIIPDITNPFYPAFERGIQDVADRHGYDLITYNTDGSAVKEQKVLRSIQQGRVDGAIVVLFHTTARELIALLEMNIAVIRLEAAPKRAGALPLDNLYVDNSAAARTAVGYLIARGHTRIGLIASASGPGRVRAAGYRQALAEHQLALDDTLIRLGDFTAHGGYLAARELLALVPRPSAIFAANDQMAMGALVAIREAGLRIPDDIAVVGFDNIPTAELVAPPLTTITQFQEQLGQRAAEMLLERLEGRTQEGGRCVEMPYKLIVRESA